MSTEELELYQSSNYWAGFLIDLPVKQQWYSAKHIVEAIEAVVKFKVERLKKKRLNLLEVIRYQRKRNVSQQNRIAELTEALSVVIGKLEANTHMDEIGMDLIEILPALKETLNK